MQPALVRVVEIRYRTHLLLLICRQQVTESLLAKVRFGTKVIELPGSRVARIAIGVALVLLGLLGFLPILGFWMVPLGLIILSADIPAIRRLNRRVSVAVSRWWTGRKPRRTSRVSPES
jgi:hypothetical protein